MPHRVFVISRSAVRIRAPALIFLVAAGALTAILTASGPHSSRPPWGTRLVRGSRSRRGVVGTLVALGADTIPGFATSATNVPAGPLKRAPDVRAAAGRVSPDRAYQSPAPVRVAVIFRFELVRSNPPRARGCVDGDLLRNRSHDYLAACHRLHLLPQPSFHERCRSQSRRTSLTAYVPGHLRCYLHALPRRLTGRLCAPHMGGVRNFPGMSGHEGTV